MSDEIDNTKEEIIKLDEMRRNGKEVSFFLAYFVGERVLTEAGNLSREHLDQLEKMVQNLS